MNAREMRRAADDVSELLKTLANPNRLIALCELCEGERSVGELAERVGVRDQAMSQQLSILRAKGLVKTRREGQTIHYSLARDDVRRVIGALYDEYCGGKTRGRRG
jgi:DNA-binding transcriptional ArsR family regulator